MSIPITSIYKLRNFSPATTDLNVLKFAVRTPDNILVQKDGFQFVLNSKLKGRPNLQEIIYLERINNPVGLSRFEREGFHLHEYRIAPEDVERFRRFRQEAWINKENGAEGSFEIDVKTCRKTQELPSKVPISTYVNARETNGYVALMRNVDILSKDTGKTAEELVPKCT